MNITKPIRVDSSVILELEETISDRISWTAKLPQGELEKLKKVCKPIATDNDLTIWILDEKKVNFIS